MNNANLISMGTDEKEILKAYYENVGLAWFVSNLDGDILQADHNFCSRLGYSMEELLNQNIKNILHENEKDSFDQFLSKNEKSEKNGQKRFIKKDGSTQFLSFKSILLNKSDSSLIRVWYINSWEVVNQTISKLQKDSLMLKVMLENTSDIIYYKDLESRFLVVSNSKIKRCNVVDTSMIIGKTDFDFFTKEHSQKAFDDEQEIIRTGEPKINMEEKETWLDGTITWASTSKMPYYDEEGKIIGTFGISRDITEKKKIETEINEKNKILNGILNNLPVIIFKMDENCEFSLLQGTPSRIESFQKSRTAKLNIKDTLQLARKKLRQSTITEDYFSFTSNHVAKQDEWHFENFVFKEINDDNTVAGFSIDITDRKNSEQEMKRHTKNLQKINKELDQFAYVVSHDLKAPLRAINNLSEWIEEDLGDDVDPDIITNFQLLRGRVHRLQSLIDGILEYSRVGRIHLTAELIDTDTFINELIDNLGIPDNFKIIKKTKMPTIMLNKIRLEQIFTNLISNAIKYHDKDSGTVEIDYEFIEQQHQFSVTDDGPGISSEYHEKIFMIFQTLQPRDSVESTGVGLSIVKKIIEEQGGRVWIESEPGKGAKFVFSIPEHNE